MLWQKSGDSDLLRILYVGTFPPPEGGVRLGVQTLADALSARSDVRLHKVDLTTALGVLSRVPFYLRRLLEVVRHGRQSDVITFCAPTNYTVPFGSAVFLVSRLLRRPLVIRHTAGHNDRLYRDSNALTRFILRKTVLSADLSLYQTSSQVEFFQSVHSNEILHFPNHRKMPVGVERSNSKVAKRFVFIGRLEPAKGTDDLLEVFSSMPEDIELDLYGKDNLNVAKSLETTPNIRYLGTFGFDQIFEVLQKYDALILPSLYEGQPGVIVESFLAGRPVIATKIPGVQDIVGDGENGLLVTPKAKDELRAAIETLATQEDVYQRLSQNVWDDRRRFSSDFWSQFFFEQCESLAHTSKGKE